MGNSVKKLAVLGSTGSIGRQTLEVVRTLPNHFKIVALAAGRNIRLLAEQIEEFKPSYIYHERDVNLLSLSETEYRFLPLEDIACHQEEDTVIVATSGKAGLKATLAAAKAGKKIALANKESLVMAGQIIMAEATRTNAKIMPIDSEH